MYEIHIDGAYYDESDDLEEALSIIDLDDLMLDGYVEVIDTEYDELVWSDGEYV